MVRKVWVKTLAASLLLFLGWFGLATQAPASDMARLPSGVALPLDRPLSPVPADALRGTGLTSAFKGQDAQGTEFALVEVALPWHLSWILKLFPELSMEFAEEHIQSALRKQLALGPEDQVTTELVQRSGFPGVFVEMARSAPPGPASDTGRPAEGFRAAQQMAGHVLLINGRFAIATTWSRSATEELPLDIVHAIQMPYEREPGNAEAQFRVVCVASGMLLLAALGLVLGCVVVIDKTLRRRKLQRLGHA